MTKGKPLSDIPMAQFMRVDCSCGRKVSAGRRRHPFAEKLWDSAYVSVVQARDGAIGNLMRWAVPLTVTAFPCTFLHHTPFPFSKRPEDGSFEDKALLQPGAVPNKLLKIKLGA